MGRMQKFTMRCSVCERAFELQREALPVDEPAPEHTPLYDGKAELDTPCLGMGQVLLTT